MYGVIDTDEWEETAANMVGIDMLESSVYQATIRDAAQRIRSAAPQARIILSSYQEITSGDAICPINVIPDHPGAITVPGLDKVQVTMHDLMQQAAQRADIEFYDLLAATRGHGICATPDSERYVAALVDSTAEHNTGFHPTIRGAAGGG